MCLTAKNSNGSDTRCDTLRLLTTLQSDPTMWRRVELWPNPFGERLNVLWSARLPGAVFRLYDCLGRVVLSAPMPYGFSELDTSGLPPGMYVWELRARGERVRAGRLMKG